MASESQDSLAEQYTVPSQQHLPRNALEKGRKSLRSEFMPLLWPWLAQRKPFPASFIHAEQDKGEMVSVTFPLKEEVFIVGFSSLLKIYVTNKTKRQQTEGRTQVQSLHGWWEEKKKKKEHNISNTLQYLYLHILTLTHTENFAEVLKPPQSTLFVCFLLPCYITSVTTTGAIAAVGGAGSITQSRWWGSCTGPRSLCRVACVLLWLRPIVWVLGCPGGSSGTAHGVNLREQPSSRLVLCIVF